MIEKEPQILGEQISQEQKEQISPFDLYLEEKLNELNNIELQGSKEEIAEQVGKIIWEKLKDIFMQFPQIALLKEDDIQSYADNMKTYAFTMKSLLNFALKYEEDETRRGLYQAFFSKRIKEQENDIHKYLETQKPKQFSENYTPEEIHTLEKLCLEWQKYNKKQTEEVLEKVDFSETGHAPAMKALAGIRPIDAVNYGMMIKEIREVYPFMRHIAYKVKQDTVPKEQEMAVRNANHVVGTSTLRVDIGEFIEEAKKFSFELSYKDVFIYLFLKDKENLEEVKKSQMTRKMFNISDDPEKELREVEEKFKKLGVV